MIFWGLPAASRRAATLRVHEVRRSPQIFKKLQAKNLKIRALKRLLIG
jgi:hypothetical protein